MNIKIQKMDNKNFKVKVYSGPQKGWYTSEEFAKTLLDNKYLANKYKTPYDLAMGFIAKVEDEGGVAEIFEG